MQAQHLSRFAATLSIEAVLLAGCGGSQPPIGAAGAMPLSHGIAQHAAPAASNARRGMILDAHQDSSR